MSTIDEARSNQNTPLNASLVAGLEAISYNQTVTFTKYVRVVLPLDGFVFWVKADQLSESALYNAASLNSVAPNEIPVVLAAAPVISVKGSFHFATDVTEEESETSSTNRVIFTSEQQIEDLNAVGPEVLYIGVFEGMRFAFGSRSDFYRQADIHHYVGRAVVSTLATQIVDNPLSLDMSKLVVSNSLPVWLSMNSYVKQEWELFGPPIARLWPSYLSPLNAEPPFGTVHVEGSTTAGIQATPFLDSVSSHSQLCTETVRIVLYGFDNRAALDFADFVNQFSVNTDLIGIMNIPVMRDEKRPQLEFNALAQRKSITFEVSYYQSQIRALARQLIESAFITYYLGDRPLP